jgi:hypothetical protein
MAQFHSGIHSLLRCKTSHHITPESGYDCKQAAIFWQEELLLPIAQLSGSTIHTSIITAPVLLHENVDFGFPSHGSNRKLGAKENA